MKLFFKILLHSFVFASIVACSDDGIGDASPSGGDSKSVCYILNSGDWKSNNSSLTMYDESTGNAVQNYFALQNGGRGLGNTANDMIVYGSKIYIAVAGESTIEVAGLDAKSIKQISCGAQPRYLAAHEGKVYATYYDGYVARIDTLSLEVEAKVKVGRNPEQLAVYKGRIYVANSGGMDYNTALGYDNTVSVIDLASFVEMQKIGVVLNPSSVVAADGGVFVASYGNYADIPSTLQLISEDGGVSVVGQCSNMTEICWNNGVLYGYFSQYDANWNATITYLSYDPSAGTVDVPWIKESFLPVPYKVCAVGEYVCVTSSDYINDGDAYVYDRDGMLRYKVPAGLNPVKAVRIE